MHQQSADHVEGCLGMHSPSAAFPKEPQVNIHPRRSSRWRQAFKTATEMKTTTEMMLAQVNVHPRRSSDSVEHSK
jgi:hypothetical protein